MPDLAANMVAGYNTVDHNDYTTDNGGRGTAVASIASGGLDNSIGVAPMCSRCSLTFCFSEPGTTKATLD